MRYHILATDYDGTLAHNGRVDEPTLAALEKLLASGRRLVMVTGRELPDLLATFHHIDLFELVVAENGALLYHPATRQETPLSEPPPSRFVETLRQRGVGPISLGRVIVATWEPHENVVLQTIRDLGLEMQVIFNKGAVMVLPTGVNKATGLKTALQQLSLSAHNVVGVGDAENDHAFMRLCECSVAVANALAAVKETADLVTSLDHGAGVSELIGRLVSSDLRELDGRLDRHYLPIGAQDGTEIKLPPYGPAVLIAGPSASGKSTVATLILEALLERRYQFCVIDPEGDYESLAAAIVVGGPKGVPMTDEVLQLLQNSDQSVVVSLTGMPISERPPFFLSLLPPLLQMRARTGRPHWLVLDEAHHLMPADWQAATGLLPDAWHNALLITVHPDMLAKSLLERVATVLTVGAEAQETMRRFFRATGIEAAREEATEIEKGEFLFWSRESKKPAAAFRAYQCQMERRRHRRKYAEGALPPERSFYFRGPEDKLNIRVQNLMMFLQVAEGVDDETWNFHLERGDYAKWFRETVKDEALAVETERIGALANVKADESRKLVRDAVEHDYTLPGTPPLPVPGAS